MAGVVLKNVKKVYPLSASEKKREEKRLSSGEAASNLEMTKVGVVAVQPCDLEIYDKEFVVLVGPSGCGKSTMLRVIAGLEELTEGEVYIGGELMNNVAPKDRDIAMVFQNYALYPHMTVYENMAFALKLKKYPKAVIDERVREAADILGISKYLNRRPKSLSGGQRQRVAIGRAIVRSPKVFLMDEPLSNLDAKLRNQMRAEIIKLREKVDTTFIYVTHDQVEAMTLGDRIVVMRNGFIQQVGTPQEVFNHPKNLFVAGFIGTPQMNFIRDAKLVRAGERYSIELMGRTVELTDEQCEALLKKEMHSGAIIAGVRPVHIVLGEEGWSAIVDIVEMMGAEMHVHMLCGGQEIVAVVPASEKDEENRLTGKKLCFDFSAGLMHIFDSDTEECLF